MSSRTWVIVLVGIVVTRVILVWSDTRQSPSSLRAPAYIEHGKRPVNPAAYSSIDDRMKLVPPSGTVAPEMDDSNSFLSRTASVSRHVPAAPQAPAALQLRPAVLPPTVVFPSEPAVAKVSGGFSSNNELAPEFQKKLQITDSQAASINQLAAEALKKGRQAEQENFSVNRNREGNEIVVTIKPFVARGLEIYTEFSEKILAILGPEKSSVFQSESGAYVRFGKFGAGPRTVKITRVNMGGKSRLLVEDSRVTLPTSAVPGTPGGGTVTFSTSDYVERVNLARSVGWIADCVPANF